MRHLYECPVRWADLDQLNHVNNVKYGDYLQEARVDLFGAFAPWMRVQDLTGRPEEALVVVANDITYLAPMPLRRSVMVECWVSEIRAAQLTVSYEIFSGMDDERTVYARAATVLAPFVFETGSPRRITAQEKAALEPLVEPAPTQRPVATDRVVTQAGAYDVHVRFSDVDVYGHVNNVTYLEYFQEARIAFMSRVTKGVESARDVNVVVARSQVEYVRPVTHRSEPYRIDTWISRLGGRSMVVESALVDGEDVLSRSRVVMVFFDRRTQRSAEPSAELYAAVQRHVVE